MDVREAGGRTRDGDIGVDELQLAARNSGMPLEALDWPITPLGLHYLLIHYDIPRVDPASWSLHVGGRVRGALTLSLDDLRSRPGRTIPVTMECAGNGRARLEPRPVSQPWLVEAVGTAEWTGTPLRALLDEAGVDDDAIEIVFTGLDHGIEGGIEQDYERSLSVADARHDAQLDDAELGPYAWRTWSWTWEPEGPGDYELWCRARDATGNEQPVDANWNVKGYENNVVQSVPVTVR